LKTYVGEGVQRVTSRDGEQIHFGTIYNESKFENIKIYVTVKSAGELSCQFKRKSTTTCQLCTFCLRRNFGRNNKNQGNHGNRCSLC